MIEKIKGVFDKKNVVVTGGAGFIGSHLCEELLKKGDSKVICLDNLISGLEINIDLFLQSPDFKFIKHDIVETIDLAAFPELSLFQIDIQGIQEIYHCASPTSYKDPKKFALQTALTNTRGTKNVLDLAKQYQAKIVHLSSSAIYGDPMPETKYFKEDYWGFVNPLGERASYDESKRYAETLCRIYSDSEAVDAKIARIFATYGPRMKMGEGRSIPDFIGNALDNKDIVIYGGEAASSSYCYVKDVVDGLFKLMAAGDFGPFNIGDPNERKLAEVAQTIIKLLNSTSKVVFAPPLPGLSIQGLPDIKLAKERISWFPVMPMDKGLEETIHYIQSARSHYEEKGLWQFDSPAAS